MPQLAQRNDDRRHSGGPGQLLMVLIDVDRFKQINDTYGHASGDVVLQAVATRLRQSVRDSDMLVRWGGEEFLLALNACDPNMAGARLRTVLELVSDHAIAVGDNLLNKVAGMSGLLKGAAAALDSKGVSAFHHELHEAEWFVHQFHCVEGLNELFTIDVVLVRRERPADEMLWTHDPINDKTDQDHRPIDDIDLTSRGMNIWKIAGAAPAVGRPGPDRRLR